MSPPGYPAGQSRSDTAESSDALRRIFGPLRGVGKAIGNIPLVGEEAEDLTGIRLEIKGPLEKPEIRPAEAKQILKGIKTEVKEPEKILKDFDNRLKEIF